MLDRISSLVLSVVGVLVWGFLLYSFIFNPSMMIPLWGFVLTMGSFLLGGLILGVLAQRALDKDL